MKLPFTTEQFLDVFKDYNLAVFPAQVLIYLLGLFAFYLTIKPGNNSRKFISLILAFLWIWMGVVYHVIFFTAINKAAYIFGSAFILQGILFMFYGVFQNKLSFAFRFDLYGIMGLLLIFFAMAGYPVLGYFLGHRYPYSPTFGLPCPTTIFTFGILLLQKKKCPLLILLIPLLWSVIGFTAAFKLGIVEDTSLFISGLIALYLLVIRKRATSE